MVGIKHHQHTEIMKMTNSQACLQWSNKVVTILRQKRLLFHCRLRGKRKNVSSIPAKHCLHTHTNLPAFFFIPSYLLFPCFSIYPFSIACPYSISDCRWSVNKFVRPTREKQGTIFHGSKDRRDQYQRKVNSLDPPPPAFRLNSFQQKTKPGK